MRSFKLALGFMLTASVAAAQSYPSPTVNNLTVLGTGTVPFTQTGTGAVATTVDAKLKKTLSLTDFGAVCDSSTDNSTALQNFFTAVVAQNRAGYIPGCANKYNYSTTIFIGSAGFVNVYGDGKFASVLSYTGTGTAINISPSSVIGGYVNFSDFGVYNATMNAGAAGIYQTNATQSIYTNMAFFNQANCLSLGTNSFAVRITNISANTCGSGGAGAAIIFANDSSANNAVISGAFVQNGGGYALYIPNGNAISINGFDSEGNYGGLQLGGVSPGITSVSIDGGSYIENSGAGGNIIFLGTNAAGTNAKGVTLANTWLGASTANNWNEVQGLVIKNLTTYNYAPYVAASSSGTLENLITMGTGGLTWATNAIARVGVGAINCSGTPSASFAVVRGIVTAC
jgi:hypothetical protein